MNTSQLRDLADVVCMIEEFNAGEEVDLFVDSLSVSDKEGNHVGTVTDEGDGEGLALRGLA